MHRVITRMIYILYMNRYLGSALAAVLVTAQASRAELIRHWEFDGDFTESVAEDHAIPVNGAGFGTDRFGIPNMALSVNGGLRQYVKADGGGGLNNLQAGSISMFVRWVGTQDANGFGSNANVTGRQKNNQFNNQVTGLSSTNPANGRLTWQPYRTDGVITGTTPVGDGVWRHVAITYSSGGHTVYLDGEIDATGTLTGVIRDDGTVPLTIGAWIDHGDGYATGQIDDVRIYDHILTQDEVRSLALPVPTEGLLAYYPLNGNADDASGKGNHGIISGAQPATDADGNTAGCLRFDGNDFVEIPGFNGAHPSGSVAAWVTAEGYDTGIDQLNLIFGQNDNLQLGLGDSAIGADGKWVFRHRSAAGFVNPAGPLPNLGRWIHVAGVWTETEAILYLDGAEASRAPNGILTECSAPAKIGSHPYAPQNHWKGKIDDLVLYDRALNLVEIQRLASAHPTDFELSISMPAAPPTSAALGWNSTPGSQFRIHHSDNLKDWTPGSLVLGTAGQNRVNHSIPTGSNPSRFYRVERILGSEWNLALGKAISTNASYPNQPAQSAIDGNRDSLWSSTDHGTPSNPNWLKLDLGSVQDIGRVFLWFVYSNGQYDLYNNIYNLYGSEDDTSYSLIASGTLIDSPVFDDRSDTIILPAGARRYRYLRYEVIGGSHWSSLNEMEVYLPGS